MDWRHRHFGTCNGTWKIWHPKFDSREMIGSFSKACCYSAGRITFHVSFAFFPAVPLKWQTLQLFSMMTRGFPMMHWYQFPSWSVRSTSPHSILIIYNMWQRLLLQASLGLTKSIAMILRKAFRSNVFGLPNVRDFSYIFCGKGSDLKHTPIQARTRIRLIQEGAEWNQTCFYFYSNNLAIWFVSEESVVLKRH